MSFFIWPCPWPNRTKMKFLANSGSKLIAYTGRHTNRHTQRGPTEIITYPRLKIVRLTDFKSHVSLKTDCCDRTISIFRSFTYLDIRIQDWHTLTNWIWWKSKYCSITPFHRKRKIIWILKHYKLWKWKGI